MRTKRSIRKRGIRKKIEPLDIDITSLLDILVILLIFLLKSYNTSGVVFNIDKEIKLPYSQSSKINTPGVIVQVNPNLYIIVDGKTVLDLRDPPPRLYDGLKQKRIISLYEALEKKREEAKVVHKTVPNAKPFSGIINFVIDKKTGYNYVKKLLYTAAEAGFHKYNFVVIGEQY